MDSHDMFPAVASSRTSVEELAVKSLENVREPIDTIDIRLGNASRPTTESLDKCFSRQLNVFICDEGNQHQYDPEKNSTVDSDAALSYVGFVESTSNSLILSTFQVEFENEDVRDPVYYPKLLKWTITLVGCGFTLLAGECLT
jgi:hypothetical protein